MHLGKLRKRRLPCPLLTTKLESSLPEKTAEPCCKECRLPLVKFFSTDAAHGFCGEACMDPTKFDLYHKFEANLTRADHLPYPCSQQRTPDNKHHYIKYTSTVTHGVPGLLAVTLDLYAPNDMPDHSCCVTPLFSSLKCFGIPGKPQSMTLFGTGPYCCPSSATETNPCASAFASQGAVAVPVLPSAAAPVIAAEKPCCEQCTLPLVKFFSTDAPHGFCGEACMDPAKFNLYHKFEANLTKATSDHPCSTQLTPSNTLRYTDYFSTVTHGVPGLLAVTLDLYSPTNMPDHSCCVTPLFSSLNCVGIPGKAKSMTIAGTGPFCCPSGATESNPCPGKHYEADGADQMSSADASLVLSIPDYEAGVITRDASQAAEPCCKECKLPLVKFFSTDAAHGFCGEACMDPAKFDLYHKFEANLTKADRLPYPCSQQRTPDNKHHYTKYTSTVTHGVPGLLAVTLDLYAPNDMPDHSCCVTPLFSTLNCFGIPGKSKSMTIFGTGPYCCPSTATESNPCTSTQSIMV